MERYKTTYEIAELEPYISWTYFFYAWQVRDGAEQKRLRDEAEDVLRRLDGRYRAHAVVMVAAAGSDGDDIVVDCPDGEAAVTRLPMLRQQCRGECACQPLCLADYVRPMTYGWRDRIGLFATTVDRSMETDYAGDEYKRMMSQLLADRLAEAAAERLHEYVRTTLWGYAAGETLSIDDMLAGRYVGLRPAVGYPSLPDTSVNFILARVTGFADIGIRLTESGAMRPHASVSGLMIACPQARYFSVGTIGEDQLRDYSSRRGIPLALMRRFIAANME